MFYFTDSRFLLRQIKRQNILNYIPVRSTGDIMVLAGTNIEQVDVADLSRLRDISKTPKEINVKFHGHITYPLVMNPIENCFFAGSLIWRPSWILCELFKCQ